MNFNEENLPEIAETAIEETRLEWEAPVRPFRELRGDWLSTAAVVLVLVSLVAIFLQDLWLLVAVFALSFVAYVLFTTPPQTITHRVSPRGLFFGEAFYSWEKLARFWFKDFDGDAALVVETKKGFPPQLIMLLGSVDRQQLQSLLEENLEFVEAPGKDWLEKGSGWLSAKMGLNDRESARS